MSYWRPFVNTDMKANKLLCCWPWSSKAYRSNGSFPLIPSANVFNIWHARTPLSSIRLQLTSILLCVCLLQSNKVSVVQQGMHPLTPLLPYDHFNPSPPHIPTDVSQKPGNTWSNSWFCSRITLKELHSLTHTHQCCYFVMMSFQLLQFVSGTHKKVFFKKHCSTFYSEHIHLAPKRTRRKLQKWITPNC